MTAILILSALVLIHFAHKAVQANRRIDADIARFNRAHPIQEPGKGEL
jgi:hypothetical protein